MYRNVYFDRKNSIIHHWGFDADGTPNKKEVKFKPYIYLESHTKAVDAVGIDGKNLVKKEFSYEWERRNFLKDCSKQVYFNLPPTQQYLLENYYDEDILELTKFPLRIFFYDIEVIADEFQDAKEAKYPITSITLYDTYRKKFQVFGTRIYNEYTVKDHLKDVEPDEINYHFCVGERDLLKKFLRYWRANFPDMVVGYNSYSFDMPYIVNRLTTLFGEDAPAKLSPVDNIYGVEKENRYKQKYTEYTIGGIAHLDYMILYKYFTPGERESDSLDFVSYEELQQNKLEYDGSLNQLCSSDWNKFINYNIWDVKLLMMLDAKKKYIEIAKFSAFSGFCNLDKAFGKISIITGVLAKQSLQKHRIIPTQTDGVKEDIPGGYVKRPEPGLYEDIISFDCNSLYPSNIITLNISPETKVAKITSKTDTHINIFEFNNNKTFSIERKKFYSFIQHKNWSIAPNGVMFTQKIKSISSQFVDDLYAKRKNVKDKMLELTKQQEKMLINDIDYQQISLLISQLDTEQYLYKILLNSTYGAFANRYFSLYDPDCASAITTSGQAMIKQSEKIVNQYLISEWNLDEKDFIVAMDTDSLLFSIKELCDKHKISIINDNGDLTDSFVEVENKIANHLNVNIQEWARTKLNSIDPRYYFKRESVCLKAIWTGKKHYILFLVNKEGKKMRKFKYSGLTIAKSTWTNCIKDICKKIVEHIMTTKNENEANNLIYDVFEQFKSLSINDIAERGSIKVLNKWDYLSDGFRCAKGTTRAAKYSIYYNELLKKIKLDNVYKQIENGSKIKMVYIKDNFYDLEGIAYQTILPPEFDLEVDYEKMFFKEILKSLEPIYNAMHWNMPDPKNQYTISLEDIFS